MKSANQLYKEYVKQCKSVDENPLSYKQWIDGQKKQSFLNFASPPVDKQLNESVMEVMKKTTDCGCRHKRQPVEKTADAWLTAATIAALLAVGFFLTYKRN